MHVVYSYKFLPRKWIIFLRPWYVVMICLFFPFGVRDGWGGGYFSAVRMRIRITTELFWPDPDPGLCFGSVFRSKMWFYFFYTLITSTFFIRCEHRSKVFSSVNYCQTFCWLFFQFEKYNWANRTGFGYGSGTFWEARSRINNCVSAT